MTEFIEEEKFWLGVIMNKTGQKRQLDFGSFRPQWSAVLWDFGIL